MSNNNLESLLIFLFIGLIAGWLAGILVKGRGFGILGDIIVGVVGAQIGGWLFYQLGLSAYGFFGAVAMALVGAVILLGIIKLVVNASKGKIAAGLLILTAACVPANASTTVTVDDNNQVIVSQPATVQTTQTIQTVSTPVVVTRQESAADFEGRIAEINYSRYVILVHDSNSQMREVAVQPETINSYRIGDYVTIRPTTEVTRVILQENPRVFEGEIIRVDMSDSQIMVQDTTGRERRVQLKQGMIGTYKVDDYVRVHLMSDMKEALKVETLRGVRHLEGRIVSIDSSRSQIVVRGKNDVENTVIVRQGQIGEYRIGDNVRIYLLDNHDQAQVIRVIR